MTKQAFIDKHKYELAGMVLEAQMNPRSGAELATSLRPLFTRIEAVLGAAYESLQPAAEQKPGPAVKK